MAVSSDPDAQIDADARSFASWVEPHWAVLHGLAVSLCGRSDADDVLQEALAAAWRKRDQFHPHRGSPRSWLLAIVADQARKQWAAERSRMRRDRRQLTDVEAGDVRPDGAVVFDVRRAIHRLSPRQRVAISLYYYLDLPVAEVAQAMACSIGTVKSTLSDARLRLQELLGDEQ